MRVRILVGTALVALVMASGSSGATTTTPAAAPASGIYVDMAAWPTLSVSVVAPLESSTAPRLLENGIPITLESATNVGRARSTAIVVDHSRSMHGVALRNAIAAARALLTTRRRGDRLAVYSAASQALRLTPFSDTPAAGVAALRTISLDKKYGTRLYDAALMAVDDLKHQPGPGKLVLLVTDGQDTTSRAGIAETAAAASAAGVHIYPVAIKSTTYLPDTLLRLARASTGAFFGTATRSSATASARIASDIRRTWQLTYTTTAPQGTVLSIEVVQPHAAAVSTSVTLPGTTHGQSHVAQDGVIALVILLLGTLGFVIYRAVKPSS